MNTGKVAVRYGHCKVYCFPHELQRVTDALAFSRAAQRNDTNASGQNSGSDNATQVRLLAEKVQFLIANRFSSTPIATLADALRVVRQVSQRSENMKKLLKKVRCLNDSASFLRHFSPGWGSGLIGELECELSNLLSSNLPDMADYALPPVPPPPEEVFVPTAGLAGAVDTAVLAAQQSLIENQSRTVHSLVQHMESVEAFANSQSQSLVSKVADLEYKIMGNIELFQDSLREIVGAAVDTKFGKDSPPSVRCRGAQIESGANVGITSVECEASAPRSVTRVRSIGVHASLPSKRSASIQVSPNVNVVDAAVGSIAPRWADTLDVAVSLKSIGIQARPQYASAAVGCNIISGGEASSTFNCGEESVESESSSQFDGDSEISATEDEGSRGSNVAEASEPQSLDRSSDIGQHWLVGKVCTLDFNDESVQVTIESCVVGPEEQLQFAVVDNLRGGGKILDLDYILRHMR